MGASVWQGLFIGLTILHSLDAFPAHPQRNMVGLRNERDSSSQDDTLFSLDEPTSVRKESVKNDNTSEAESSPERTVVKSSDTADVTDNREMNKEVEPSDMDAISEAMLAMGGMVSDEPIDVRTSLPSVAPVDYYDYLSMPAREVEEPSVPDQGMNVNDDYAGIYDYRGQNVGRFRRKRTLTTNLEQFITRQSRVSRAKRSVGQRKQGDGSPGEQAESLITLLTALAETNPDFSIQDFLKVMDEPRISEDDMEYLLYLSNLATMREKEMMARQDQLEESLYQNHRYENLQPTEDFAENDDYRVILLPQNSPRQKVSVDANGDMKRGYGQVRSRKQIPAGVDLTGLYAIATLMAQDDASAMAM